MNDIDQSIVEQHRLSNIGVHQSRSSDSRCSLHGDCRFADIACR